MTSNLKPASQPKAPRRQGPPTPDQQSLSLSRPLDLYEAETSSRIRCRRHHLVPLETDKTMSAWRRCKSVPWVWCLAWAPRNIKEDYTRVRHGNPQGKQRGDGPEPNSLKPKLTIPLKRHHTILMGCLRDVNRMQHPIRLMGCSWVVGRLMGCNPDVNIPFMFKESSSGGDVQTRERHQQC